MAVGDEVAAAADRDVERRRHLECRQADLAGAADRGSELAEAQSLAGDRAGAAKGQCLELHEVDGDDDGRARLDPRVAPNNWIVNVRSRAAGDLGLDQRQQVVVRDDLDALARALAKHERERRAECDRAEGGDLASLRRGDARAHDDAGRGAGECRAQKRTDGGGDEEAA